MRVASSVQNKQQIYHCLSSFTTSYAVNHNLTHEKKASLFLFFLFLGMYLLGLPSLL